MNQEIPDFDNALTVGINDILPELEKIYKDLHAHPELSFQETRTAEIAAQHLRECGFEVTEKTGKTGAVGLLENGAGPTVMLRAEADPHIGNKFQENNEHD